MKTIGYLIILDLISSLEEESVDFLENFEEDSASVIEVVFVYGDNPDVKVLKHLIDKKYRELALKNKRTEKEERAFIEAGYLLPYLENEDCFSPIPPAVYDWVLERDLELSTFLFVKTERED